MAIKNSKFESFLNRILDDWEQQVKLYEPCVVLSKNEKHSFRFMFATGDAISVTENPPKSVIFSIPFSTMTGIELIHDTATFLQKDLQNIVQHVLIRHTHRTTKKLAPTLNLPTAPEESAHTTKSQTSIVKSVLNLLTKKKSEDFGSATSLRSNASSNYNSNNNSNRSESTEACETLSTQSSSSLSRAPSGDLGVEEIHFYILNETSTMYQMLRVLWKSYMLNATSSIGIDVTSTPTKSSKTQKETTKVLFSSLKEDLISAYKRNECVEVIHKYFFELQFIAKEKDSIQHLFWRDTELFILCGQTLTRYLNQQTHDVNERADEIECMVLVVEILAKMLHQTEGLTACHKVLQTCSAAFHANLISSLLHEHLFPPSLTMSENMMELVDEYNTAATDVLFHLMEITAQVSWNWNGSKDPDLTGQKLFREIENHSGLRTFIDRIVSRCVRIWERNTDGSVSGSPRSVTSLSAHEPLSGADTVTIYRMLFVLHQCLLKCKPLARHAPKYKEEFRYFIRNDTETSKIPSSYPCCSMVLEMLKNVKFLVLGENV
uniref:Uncharacterized protein n=1 Tax=Ciona intestinalis TaxID=7719 RepID=F6QGK7_CIOIN|nr:uncharacterized protein C12orf56 [Ciona intestinalis]|eukprot:XP_002127084.1 uncharacterized protein C12orf56 [Ciona intestinalis]